MHELNVHHFIRSPFVFDKDDTIPNYWWAIVGETFFHNDYFFVHFVQVLLDSLQQVSQRLVHRLACTLLNTHQIGRFLEVPCRSSILRSRPVVEIKLFVHLIRAYQPVQLENSLTS